MTDSGLGCMKREGDATPPSRTQEERDYVMSSAKTVMGKKFEYSGTLATGITVFFKPPKKLRIRPEIIQVIRDEITRRSPVRMGANWNRPAPDSVGETLVLRHKQTPRVMSYVIPLLIEEGFCTVAGAPSWLIHRR